LARSSKSLEEKQEWENYFRVIKKMEYSGMHQAYKDEKFSESSNSDEEDRRER
jgi:hypothetical protein